MIAARIAEQWINSDYARLHAVELTPDEALLVAAVAQAIADEIRRTRRGNEGGVMDELTRR